MVLTNGNQIAILAQSFESFNANNHTAIILSKVSKGTILTKMIASEEG